MSVAVSQASLTFEDLAARYGKMPAWRIRTAPPPGTATEEDVLRIFRAEGRLCELVDGVLLEKDVAADSSLIAGFILTVLNNFVLPRGLGFLLGEQGVLRLSIGRLRAPDVSFIRGDQTPGGAFPREPIPELDPTIAVEVLSPGNTRPEIEEKLDDYFASGTELVWIVDPVTETIRVLTGRRTETMLRAHDTLDGGTALPGFSIPVADVFAVLKLRRK